jgi:LPXTG-motif cell wall-anchored protein
MNIAKRFFSVFMAFIMMLSLFPTSAITAFAQDASYSSEYIISNDEYAEGENNNVVRATALGAVAEKITAKSLANNQVTGPEGDAKFKDAAFKIRNVSGEYIKFTNPDNGAETWVQNGADVPYTFRVIDPNSGLVSTPGTTFSYGTYEIREVVEDPQPIGYLNNGSWRAYFDIRTDGAIVTAIRDTQSAANASYSGDNASVQNTVMRVSVSVQKYDSDRFAYPSDGGDTPTQARPQGDASLEGAVIRVFNSSDAAITFGTGSEKRVVAVGGTVADIRTDRYGYASLSGLPYGTYTFKEISPPTGYLLPQNSPSYGTTEWVVVKEMHGANGAQFYIGTNGNTKSDGVKDDVIRGQVQVQKLDNETHDNHALADAGGTHHTFAGAQIQIINRSAESIYYIPKGKLDSQGVWIPVNGVVDTLVTDDNGYCETGERSLPYGTYQLIETRAPEGYLINESWRPIIDIRTEGEVESLGFTSSTLGRALYEQVMRGDLKFNKLDMASQEQMANVAFRITSKTTGESHIVVTDASGVFDSTIFHPGEPVNMNTPVEVAYNAAYLNRNDAAVASDGSVNTSELNPYYPTWFKGTEGTNSSYLGRRPFPYDSYTVEELRSDANEGKVLVKFEVTVNHDSQLIDRGSVQDYYPDIQTMLLEQDTQDHVSNAAANITLNDRVTYTNCKPGVTYYLKGWLVDKATGNYIIVDGSPLTGTATFTPENTDGNINLAFNLNAVNLAGKTVVAYVTMYDDAGLTHVMAESNDINNADETVHFPSISTTLTGEGRTKEVRAGENVVLIDTVSYNNLIPLQTYVMKAKLVDKSTGEVLLNGNGTELVQEVTFQPPTESGTVDVTFRFDSSRVEGKTIVCFETLTRNSSTIAEHADINDAEQTVVMPKIGTTLADENGNHIVYADNPVVLIDTVAYEGLLPNTQYTLSGILKDKITGETLVNNNNEVITATSSFTTDSTGKGTAFVQFEFSPTLVAGKTLVAFETLFHGNIDIAKHEDINDEEQTVRIPKIGTTAAGTNGEKEFFADGQIRTIIDTVEYDGLLPNQTYTMTGQLINKSNMNVISEASVEFEARESHGTVQLEFPIEVITEDFEGQSLVAFEKLFIESRLIADHEDINDADQTVSFPKIRTTAHTQENDEEHEVLATSNLVIIDTVEYWNLIPGTSYTLTGTVVDAADGKTFKDSKNEPYFGVVTFIPETPDGSIDVNIPIDTTLLDGQTLVIYEELTDVDDRKIAEHKDLSDTNQTITVPSIYTTLVSPIDEHVSFAQENITLTDTIHYQNLIPGKEYTVTGTLVNKATREPLQTETTTFTPEFKDGTVDVTFTFDATELTGQTLVAFESMSNEYDHVIAIHEDIDDEEQSVKFPSIRTTATNTDGKHEVFAKERLVIIDVVTYENLLPGLTYVMHGKLLDKEDESNVIAEAESEFTPDTESGSIELQFMFDASELDGKDLVAFERLTYNNELVAKHEDLNDADQSLNIPKIWTNTHDANEDKEFLAGEIITIVDTVNYENLTPGSVYRIVGSLTNLETGNPITDSDGVAINSEVTFTPEEENGSVDVPFVIDSSDLEDTTILVQETIYNVDGEIVADELMDVENQTVYIPKIRTSLVDADGKRVTFAGENVILTDTISYWNLQPGSRYVIVGQLMNAETGEPAVDSGGAQIQARGEFTPENPDGAVTLDFEFDASLIDGNVMVAYEYLFTSVSQKLIAKHEDIDDLEQTDWIPHIVSNATDADNNKELRPYGTIRLIDHVDYDHLQPGEMYVIEGILMDKETGAPALDPNGNQITASVRLSAREHTNDGLYWRGSVQNIFDFEATQMEGKTLVVYEYVYHDGILVASHEDMEDALQTVTFPKIRTVAHTPDNDKEVIAADGLTIIDTVKYWNLVPGNTYTLKATIIDAADGKPFKDSKVEAYIGLLTFQPETANGEIDVSIPFNASEFAGQTFVIYEELYDINDRLIGEHKDLEDTDQTMTIPEIWTTLVSEIDEDLALAEGTVVLTDTVEYRNLVPGKEYTMAGTLMDKVTGQAFMTVEQPFTPDTADGNVDVVFEFDASDLQAATLVAFESLKNDLGIVVAIHEDIDDEEQTIRFPKIRTTATNTNGKHELYATDRMVVNDVIAYENLKVGNTYVVTGKLVSKENPDEVIATGETTFRATSESGTVTVRFTFDATLLEGQTFVAFERLTLDDELVAIHEDIDDEAQTVNVPKIRTNAHDGAEGKEFITEGETTMIDTIDYWNLTPGETYTAEGILHYRATGNVVKDSDGNVIIATTEFTPSSADGSVDVVFVFDTSNMENTTIVVEETVYNVDGEVVAHEYIEENETIYIPKIRTTLVDGNDEHVTFAGDSVILTDTIYYWNLQPNARYVVEGKLMNPATGEAALDSNGDEITAKGEFTPENKDGAVTLDFEFDASTIDGSTVVAFEYLYVKATSKLIASHEDLEDENQTVDIPHIVSNAVNEIGTKELKPAGVISVIDNIDFDHLQVGEQYVIQGILMDKETGEPALDPSGAQITATVNLLAKESSNQGLYWQGSVQNRFTFDASEMEGKTLVVYERVYHNDILVASHVDINDPLQTVTFPKIRTVAHTADDDKEILATDGLTIIDTVKYWNLVPGNTYTLKALIVDAADGKPFKDDKGETYTGLTTFVPETANGEVDVNIAFDAAELAGKTFVVYEELTDVNDNPLGEHKDLEDTDQTMTIPEIWTTMVSEIDEDLALAVGTVTLTDTVEYRNLIPNKQYTMVGTLMDKVTGEAFMTQSQPFTPDTPDGNVDITFEFDASDMQAKTLVAFETLRNELDLVVGIHEDIDDEDQTIRFPKIRTTATNVNGKHELYATDRMVVNDVVNYWNLKVGKTYTVTGKLVSQDDETDVIATGETTFVATSENGSVVVKFEFDATPLEGRTFVAFEQLLHDNELVAIHEDLTDEEQTVNVPKIRTTAHDGAEGNEFIIDGETVMIDTISYWNLTPGQTYTAVGVLHYKENGNIVHDWDGNPITASTEFTPTERDGSVDVVFKFDTSMMENVTIVVEETVYNVDNEIVAHEYIEENETIYIPKIRTTLVDENEEHVTFAGDTVVLTDTIEYWNLQPGARYVVEGVLMNPETETTAVDSNGEEIRARAEFTPDEKDGTTTLDFTFDASAIDGTTLVAFEYVYVKATGKLIASHEDLTDKNQTVDIPHIQSHAANAAGEQELNADGTVTIYDSIDYDHLQPEEKYEVRGILIDKETGDPVLDPSGNEITAYQRLTAHMSENDGYYCPCVGQLKTTFKFDASEMEGKTLVVYEYVYHNGHLVAQHTDIDDPEQTITFPKIRTLAHGEGGDEDKEFLADGTVQIIDTVKYWNLVPGREYTLDATLMDKTTRQPMKDIYGYAITSVVAFIPDDVNGSQDVVFEFDASEMEGKTGVAYETLSTEFSIVATHKDLDDEDQTITFPKIRTTLLADDGTHVALAQEDLHLTDTVKFWNLLVGHTYTLTGTLMNKETGEPILKDDGTPVQTTSSFIAMAKDGSWDIEFTFDASELAGVSVVAFEQLSNDFGVIAIHEDLDDQDQTVDIPEIHTNASDEDGNKDFFANGKIKVIDVVDYYNLPLGRYKLVGSLIDKATGEVLVDAKGKEVTAEKTFRVLDTEGSVTLEFVFDSTGLKGHTLVAFERVYLGESVVAIHEDLEDEDQTVRFPEIHTEATDQYYQHATNIGTQTKIIDRVDYQNLIPGETYVVTGTLRNKADGKVLKDYAGDEVIASTEFVPETESGSVEVIFIVDTTALEDGALVAYETLTHDDRIVAEHKDIEDEAQSVYFPTIKTIAKIDGEDIVIINNETTTVTIVDTVIYNNVVPDETYVLSGTLMDCETGAVVKDENGDAIIGEATFTPTERSGEVEVTFEVPISSLRGKDHNVTKIVAFERLILGPNTLTTHEDYTDDAQIVYVPVITYITKRDASSDAFVEGAVFKIEDRGIIGSSERTMLVPTQQSTSDKNGRVYFNVLPNHEYAITEIAAPDKYFIDTNEHIVDVNSACKPSGDLVLYNIKGGTVVITKTNAVTGDALPGCEVTVYRQVVDVEKTEEAMKEAAKKLNKKVDELKQGQDYKIVYKWQFEFKQLTDRKGRVYFYTEEPGKFMFKETQTIEGFYLNEDKLEFQIDENLKVTGELALMNVPFGTIVVQKTDKDGNPLKGAKLAFWDKYDRKLGETTTDRKGRVYFVAPGPGEYYYTELVAPEGYQRTDNRYHFQLKNDYSIVGQLTLVNTKSGSSNGGKTGDTDNPMLWLAIAGACVLLAGSGAFVAVKKRKKDESSEA